jgi:hypothetical protein
MRTPRRWGPVLALGALAVITACGDSEESLDPQFRAPDEGVYQYEALVHTEEGAEPDTFVGSLQITVASEDSIVGTWDVDGYGAAARGIWNITAYTLPADPSPPIQGDITHRVWRLNGSGDLSCQLSYELVMPMDTFTSTTENSCSLAGD